MIGNTKERARGLAKYLPCLREISGINQFT